jgi:carboxyl-terminal processing protease
MPTSAAIRAIIDGYTRESGVRKLRQLVESLMRKISAWTETKGEAALKGHLKNGEDEGGGSSAYVPPDPKNDRQLNYALDLLRAGRQAADAKLASTAKPN